MNSKSSRLAAFTAMSTFVLLWGSGAIFTRWALDHGSVFAVLLLRYGMALAVLLAQGGLALVVMQSLLRARFSGTGMGFALGALLCMTLGSLLQKRIRQAPSEVLPIQYLVTLLLYACFVPFQPVHFHADTRSVISLLYLGLVISVGAQLLLYRLIRTGNLVNVTSLFYLVPVVTVILDFLILGNAMPGLALLGMAGILAGLVLVFRKGGTVTQAPAGRATGG